MRTYFLLFADSEGIGGIDDAIREARNDVIAGQALLNEISGPVPMDSNYNTYAKRAATTTAEALRDDSSNSTNSSW